MKTTLKILLIIFNSFIYMTICFLVIRNQKFSSLSIRSPILLNMNIIFLFLTQTSLLFSNSFFQNAFYFCQIPIFLSFFVRFFRIYFCVKTPSLTTSKQHFQSTSEYYTQQCYMKFLFLSLLLTMSVLAIILVSKQNIQLSIASLLNVKESFQINFWIIVNWIELMMLFTGNYLLYSYPIYHFVKIEYFIFTCLWFGFNYLITYFDLFSKRENNSKIVLCFVFCFQYCIFILIGVVPYLLTKCSQVNFAYYFTQGLCDNLFLFLSHEKCYKSFLEFLKDSEKEVLYLQLYTHVMNFKLECDTSEKNDEGKCLLLNKIIDSYFNENGINYLKNIDSELWAIGQNVKGKYNENLELEKKQECLDEVLKYVFEKLLVLFNEFKNTIDFCDLIDYLKLNSFIQCKMINVGLLNKH